MTLPASHPITWQQICTEFGLAFTAVWPAAFYGLGGAPSSGALSFGDFLGRSNGPAYPTLFGSTANSASNSSVSLTWPAGHQDKDVGIVIIATNNQNLPTPTGCTPINTPVGIGTGGNVGGTRLHAFWIRASSGSMAAIASGDSGNVQNAKLMVFRGCRETGSPIESVAFSGTGSAGTIVLKNGTPYNTKSLYVACLSLNKDANDTDVVTNFTNSGLSNITERADYAVNTSNGAGLAIFTGEPNTIGAKLGDSSAVLDASMNAEWCSFFLAPKAVAGSPDAYVVEASGTFTVPYAGTAVIHGWGGGGGGRNNGSAICGAGGGGAYARKNGQAVTASQNLTVTIGAAGTNGSASGTNGGDTSVVVSGSTAMMAKGGTGAGGTDGGAGGLASASTGDVKYNGGSGGAGAGYFDGELTQWTYWSGGPGGSGGASGAGGNGADAYSDGGAGGNDGAVGTAGSGNPGGSAGASSQYGAGGILTVVPGAGRVVITITG